MVKQMTWIRFGVFASVLGTVGGAWAQSLTLEEAITLARRNNGFILAAYADLSSARSQVRQASGSFLPTVLPTARYDSSRTETELSSGTSISRFNEASAEIDARWRLLDSGQRMLILRSSKFSENAQKASTAQTIRQILFSVHERFFNSLRNQELVRVSDVSVERANEIYKLTEAQIELKIAPRKDILQARADVLNAKVDQLGAKNQSAAADALLRSIIGWDVTKPFPNLEKPAAPAAMSELPDLQTAIKNGLAQREDLRSTRFTIEAQRLFVERARIEAGLTWAVDASYSKTFADRDSDSRAFSIIFSYPLFDGNQSREEARQAEFALDRIKVQYRQAEADAAAEIESAFRTVMQDRERLDAAKSALEAANENFKAATESQQLGAEGTNVITVLTAKISLITAESNYVNALYDVQVSEMRFRLVTGQPIPGELQ